MTATKIITSIILIFSSFLFLSLSELVFPFSQSISFNIITTSREILFYRKRIKELKGEVYKKKKLLRDLEREIKGLGIIPKERYLVVDLLRNRLFFKMGENVLREIAISTGSGNILIYGKKRWRFETPTGVLRILRKIKNPIWYKPDWAFIEEKKPIPPLNSKERLVRGVLGDYALDLGGGILIHGTPDEHLIGRSVTHGCIRVKKEDIKFLYENTSLGMKVYLYGK